MRFAEPSEIDSCLRLKKGWLYWRMYIYEEYCIIVSTSKHTLEDLVQSYVDREEQLSSFSQTSMRDKTTDLSSSSKLTSPETNSLNTDLDDSNKLGQVAKSRTLTERSSSQYSSGSPRGHKRSRICHRFRDVDLFLQGNRDLLLQLLNTTVCKPCETAVVQIRKHYIPPSMKREPCKPVKSQVWMVRRRSIRQFMATNAEAAESMRVVNRICIYTHTCKAPIHSGSVISCKWNITLKRAKAIEQLHCAIASTSRSTPMTRWRKERNADVLPWVTVPDFKRTVHEDKNHAAVATATAVTYLHVNKYKRTGTA